MLIHNIAIVVGIQVLAGMNTTDIIADIVSVVHAWLATVNQITIPGHCLRY